MPVSVIFSVLKDSDKIISFLGILGRITYMYPPKVARQLPGSYSLVNMCPFFPAIRIYDFDPVSTWTNFYPPVPVSQRPCHTVIITAHVSLPRKWGTLASGRAAIWKLPCRILERFRRKGFCGTT